MAAAGKILTELSKLPVSKEIGALFDEAFDHLTEGKANPGFAARVAACAGCTPEIKKLAEELEKG